MVKIDVDLDVLTEIAKRHTGKPGHINWTAVAVECNAKFNCSLKENAWRERYRKMIKEVGLPKDYTTIKKNLIELLKKPNPAENLEKVFKISKYELLGLVAEINEEGLYKIKETNNVFQIDKNLAEPKRVYQHSFGTITRKQFMVISDCHMGSIYELIDFLDYLYKEAKRRGITVVYNVGDIVDGYYANRPQQLYALKHIGFEAQSKNVIDNYPHEEGITTYFILGNHDETYIRQCGANIGIAIARARPDMKYLGIGTSRVMLTPNCSMDLLHPLDGSSYALSYSGQKYMDSLSGGDKPNILVVGHHHKAMSMLYRNIFYFEVPSTCLQSDWEKRNRIANQAGAWIVTVDVDEQGSIVSLSNELIPYYLCKDFLPK